MIFYRNTNSLDRAKSVPCLTKYMLMFVAVSLQSSDTLVENNLLLIDIQYCMYFTHVFLLFTGKNFFTCFI